MKQIIIFINVLAIAISSYAQESNIIECENFANKVLKDITIQMPDYREINGGTKFIVTYSGSWSEEMKGAFEYAVKMWEEVLPTSLPINITAKIFLGTGQDFLSKVSFHTYDFNSRFENNITAPSSMIKNVVLREQHRTYQERFVEELSDSTIFNNEDILITYNKAFIEDFSFSLDGDAESNKYDFITMALRDIALGLGFGTRFTANPTDQKLIFSENRRLNPYETIIMNALDTTNPYIAYQNATKGSLFVNLYNEGGLMFDSLSIYAPYEWINGYSLRYLIPEDDKPITQLLTHDFGKGYIMRDLSGVDWQELFGGALDWKVVTRTGVANGGSSHHGTSLDILPYKGKVTLSFDPKDNMPNSLRQIKYEDKSSQFISGEESNVSIMNMESGNFATVKNFCKPYNYFSPVYLPDRYTKGISISALLKNGKWDELYRESHVMGAFSLTINIEDLELHYPESEYARGTSGGLRYRLTKCIGDFDNIYGKEYCTYTVKYFTRDFTPQKPIIKYSKVYSNDSNTQNINGEMSPMSDDYFIDVVVGISNIEGTNRVVVEQLDEGESLPFEYEVTDFRKGYFIANLDRELHTQLTVLSYNDNGLKRSETINISPKGFIDIEPTFKRVGNIIYVNGLPPTLLASDKLSCVIRSIDSTLGHLSFAKINNGAIDISTIGRGLFVLTISHGYDTLGTYTFRKV